MTTAICPCYGYDLEKDEPASFGGVSMAPYGNARFNGADIKLTRSEAGILWALVKSEGRPIPKSAIANRIGYEGDRGIEIVDVHLCRIRRKLATHGAVPIKNERGIGLYLESAEA